MTIDNALEERDALRAADAYDRFKPLYQQMERADAPGQMPGETAATYRRRLLDGVKHWPGTTGSAASTCSTSGCPRASSTRSRRRSATTRAPCSRTARSAASAGPASCG